MTTPQGPPTPGAAGTVPLSSTRGRWVIAGAVLGSGIALLDGTVVNVALPAIDRQLGGGLVVQQWIVDGYLLTLSALLLLGGVLGDRYGRRRVFSIGLVAFTLASLACGAAPTGPALVVARLVQGVGGALLVPGSLALIDATIRREDHGRAVGMWAGLTGVASAVGPFVGGWLVDAASWRWVFFLNLPFAVVAMWITMRHMPESRDPQAPRRLDIAGAIAITLGLAGVTYTCIEAPARGWTPLTSVAAVIGVVGLVVFPILEARTADPLLPLGIFRSRQFTGSNLTTFAVYAALGGALFLLALQLQQSLGYSALAAGISTLPITVIMLLLSSRMGALAERTGPPHTDDGRPSCGRRGPRPDGPDRSRCVVLARRLSRDRRVRARTGRHRGPADLDRARLGARTPGRHGVRGEQRRRPHGGAPGGGRPAADRRTRWGPDGSAGSGIQPRHGHQCRCLRDRRRDRVRHGATGYAGPDGPVARCAARLSGPVHQAPARRDPVGPLRRP